jgi:hypothetical protein
MASGARLDGQILALPMEAYTMCKKGYDLDPPFCRVRDMMFACDFTSIRQV